MTSLCQRCALRLQRAAEASTRVPSRRTLSSTTTQRAKGGLPNFVPTSQPELDDILLSLRDKHLVPAALSRSERNLIFKPKNKQLLEDNPQVVTIGGEDIQLQWIDRTHDIISHRDLVPDAVNLMGKGEKRDWNNLPALLVGLHKAKLTPDDRMMGKIIRLATNSGRYGTILQCLHQAPNTGMTMQKEEVLAGVIYGLHHLAQHDGWSEASTSKAIRDANEVAMMLEDEDHGTGKFIRDNDPRRRPEVIGVFLELAAVYAWKFQGGKDVDGKVAAYAERLLSNISKAEQVSGLLHLFHRVLPLTLPSRSLPPPNPQPPVHSTKSYAAYLSGMACNSRDTSSGPKRRKRVSPNG